MQEKVRLCVGRVLQSCPVPHFPWDILRTQSVIDTRANKMSQDDIEHQTGNELLAACCLFFKYLTFFAIEHQIFCLVTKCLRIVDPASVFRA